MTRFEGEVPTVVSSGNDNGFDGNNSYWWLILLFLVFGWGRNGNGFGNNGGGSEMTGYEIGKLATQSDVASGFTNNTL